jgi:predicted enzyme related to lactoylglutathione lyase
MGRILNFHLPAADVERAVAFYRDVFGWKFTSLSDGGVPYFHASAEGIGVEAAITARTSIVAHPVPTIEVDDIDNTLARLAITGGQQGAVNDIPGIGRFAYARDSEGNTIALLQRDVSSTAPGGVASP